VLPVVVIRSFQSCLCGWLCKSGSAIGEHGLFIVEQTARTSKHQNGGRHVTVVAAASSWVANLGGELRLVLLVALASRHLRGEDARSDRVDADFAVLEGGGQHA